MNKKKELIVKKLFAINMEIEARCGNGDGTYSHSVNCACERLIKRGKRCAKCNQGLIPIKETKFFKKGGIRFCNCPAGKMQEERYLEVY